jgi:hypothetical protein
LQGDLQYVELLDHIFFKAGPKNRVKGKDRPYEKISNIKPADRPKHIAPTEENGYPFMTIFFADTKFEEAVITADMKEMKIKSDVLNAILAYIGFYFVFYIGFRKEISYFLGFLQESLLGEKYEGKVQIGFHEQMHKVRQLEAAVLGDEEGDEKEGEGEVEGEEDNEQGGMQEAKGREKKGTKKPKVDVTKTIN